MVISNGTEAVPTRETADIRAKMQADDAQLETRMQAEKAALTMALPGKARNAVLHVFVAKGKPQHIAFWAHNLSEAQVLAASYYTRPVQVIATKPERIQVVYGTDLGVLASAKAATIAGAPQRVVVLPVGTNPL